MTTTSRGSLADSTKGAWATGIGLFAAVILLMLGTFQAFEGLSAILNDKLYVAGIDYVYTFDLTVWGWIHLIVGAVAVITGRRACSSSRAGPGSSASSLPSSRRC